MMFVMDGVLGAAALVIVGVFAGNWLDAKLHTAPWWSLGLSMLGGGLGLWRLCMKAMALDTGGSGRTVTGTRKSPSRSVKGGEETEATAQDGGTSAPKAAYEHFMDDNSD